MFLLWTSGFQGQWSWIQCVNISNTVHPPDLISQLLDPVVDPWLERETCYNLISVPESYNGPRISFPLSVSDTNTLLSAFKEQQVPNITFSSFSFYLLLVISCIKPLGLPSPQILHARYVLQLLYETKNLLKQMPNIIHLSTSYTKEITICGEWPWLDLLIQYHRLDRKNWTKPLWPMGFSESGF